MYHRLNGEDDNFTQTQVAINPGLIAKLANGPTTPAECKVHSRINVSSPYLSYKISPVHRDRFWEIAGDRNAPS